MPLHFPPAIILGFPSLQAAEPSNSASLKSQWSSPPLRQGQELTLLPLGIVQCCADSNLKLSVLLQPQSLILWHLLLLIPLWLVLWSPGELHPLSLWAEKRQEPTTTWCIWIACSRVKGTVVLGTVVIPGEVGSPLTCSGRLILKERDRAFS